jgi:WD40 repeat protein
MRRRRAVAVAGCTLLLVAVLLPFGGLAIFRYRAFDHRTRHTKAVSQLSFSGDGSRLLSISRDERRWLLWETANPLDMHFGARLSGWADRGVILPDGKRGLLAVPTKERDHIDLSLVDLETHAVLGVFVGNWDPPGPVAVSPNGHHLAFRYHEDEVDERSTRANEGASDLGSLPTVNGFAFSRSGHALGIATNGYLYVTPADAAGPVGFHSGTSGVLRSVAFSPDGATVYAGGTELVACSLTTRVSFSVDLHVSALDVTPDGRSLVVLNGPSILLVDAETLTVVRTIRSSEHVTAFALSPEADRIAIGHEDGSVEVRSLTAFVAR